MVARLRQPPPRYWAPIATGAGAHDHASRRRCAGHPGSSGRRSLGSLPAIRRFLSYYLPRSAEIAEGLRDGRAAKCVPNLTRQAEIEKYAGQAQSGLRPSTPTVSFRPQLDTLDVELRSSSAALSDRGSRHAVCAARRFRSPAKEPMMAISRRTSRPWTCSASARPRTGAPLSMVAATRRRCAGYFERADETVWLHRRRKGAVPRRTRRSFPPCVGIKGLRARRAPGRQRGDVTRTGSLLDQNPQFLWPSSSGFVDLARDNGVSQSAAIK